MKDYSLNLELKSASDVIGILIKQFNPKLVIDIGCGIYLKVFNEVGVKNGI